MTTQSLRGMANHGPMHWRGDRTGGNDPGGNRARRASARSRSSTSRSPACSAAAAPISDADMQAFTDFILQVDVSAEPDPHARQHRSTAAPALTGRDALLRPRHRHASRTATAATCSIPRSGFFGGGRLRPRSRTRPRCSRSRTCATSTRRSACSACRRSRSSTPGDNGNQGPAGPRLRLPARRQRRHHLPLPRAPPCSATRRPTRQNLEQFMLPFDTNLAPIVGQQITLTSANAADGRTAHRPARSPRAAAGECDVVVKGTIAGEPRGCRARGHRASSAATAPPSRRSPTLRCAALAATAGQELTYTCVPPGLRHAHRHRSRRGRLLRSRRDRRRQRPGRSGEHSGRRHDDHHDGHQHQHDIDDHPGRHPDADPDHVAQAEGRPGGEEELLVQVVEQARSAGEPHHPPAAGQLGRSHPGRRCARLL